MKHWTLDDISWDEFDPGRVDPEVLAVVKAAAMVEHNAGDYRVYLCNVFRDDPGLCAALHIWADEEVQHGQVLGRWAEMADPDFSFKDAFCRFTDGYHVPLEVNASVRGSLTGELIARCIVETGTSSYYTALGEAVAEPVLKEICRHIAADELRHYKLFYKHMKRYLAKERLGLPGRLKVALGRVLESEDDELAYAYYAANGEGRYDRRRASRAYARRAYGFYRPRHVQRVVAMTFKAVGLKPRGRLSRGLASLVYRFMQRRVRRLALTGA